MLHWLIGRPISLPDTLLACHPMLAEARWRRGGLPPRIGGWALGAPTVAGIAVGRTVFLAPNAPMDPRLLLHELAHVHQFQQHTAFAVRYFWESVCRGYRGNRFEHDADRYAALVLSRPLSGA